MNDAPVRFGLVGFGAWGRFHAQAIERTAGAELVAIAAPSQASRESAQATHPRAAITADWQELVARDDVDVVTIVVPSYLHHAVARGALEGGKHVLLEKPMCLTLADCDDLIRLALQEKRLLAVGHELRLSSLWSRVKQLIDQGRIGRPQYVLVELSRKPYRLGSDGWRYDIRRVGNWILEEPIHFFDFARWYLAAAGEPVGVFATANARRPEHPELQDNFSAIVQFPGGAYSVVTQTLSMFEHHQTVKVAGTEGSLWASWSGAMDRTLHPTFFLKMSRGDEVQDVPIEKVTGEVYELEDQVQMMVEACRGRRSLSATGEDGRWSVAMCLAAQRSVESGRPEPLEAYAPPAGDDAAAP